MKNKYLGFTEGEISIYCSDNSRSNVICSLLQAKEIAASARRGNILYINTVFTTRNLLASARQVLGREGETSLGEKEGIFFQKIVIGDLCKHFDTIRTTIEEADIKYLIINSWEFANRSYGYKEKTLFALANLAEEYGITIFVHSQADTKNAKAGSSHRGGLGKLAALAVEIFYVEIPEEEIAKMRKLSPIKINELDYARSNSGISEGGELILPKRERVMEEEVMEV